MTDDELDLLASAYVDGEATPDEVAMVERDPELQARVELFRSVQLEEDGAASTPPAGLVDQHLTAALAEFEAIAAAGGAAADRADDEADEPGEVGRTAPVVDLRDAGARRADRGTSSSAAGSDHRSAAGSGSRGGRKNTRPARTMPSWLPAAAGFVLVGGGFLWAVGQTSGGGDDSADTEAAAISTDDSAEEAEADFDAEDGDASAMSAMSEDAMESEDDAMEEEEAMEEDAMAEDEGEADAGRADEAAESGAAPADEGDDDSAEDAEEELVELEPVLFFDEIPDVDDIVDLPEPETDIERSLCGPEIITSTLGEFVGFVPVLVQDREAEIFLFVDGDGAEIRLLTDESCQPIEP